MNKINIIIPTYNRPNYIKKLLNDIYTNNAKEIFTLYVIDDGSDESYHDAIIKFKKFDNFNYIKNKKNSGKNFCLFNIFKILKPDDNVLVIDDKDRFKYSLANVKTSELEINHVIGFDLFYENGDLIGGMALKENITVHDYYFKNKILNNYNRNYPGDKLWIFKLKQIDIKELQSLFISDEIAYEDSYWTHYLWSCKIIEVIHSKDIKTKYLESGVSKNINNLKLNNPSTYLNVLIIYFNGLKSLKFRLWYYFLIKKQIKLIKHNLSITKKFYNYKYSFLVFIFYIALYFYFKLESVGFA